MLKASLVDSFPYTTKLLRILQELGIVPCVNNSSYSGTRGRRNMTLRPAWAVNETLSQKQNTNKRAGGVVLW
jgi:hypothetical protein